MGSLFKIEVVPGITWVEAPEAGLRVLCGCPADSVKHLMRRGLIRPTEMAGVPCETGPNAILLSDTMVQNGAFCNLAEFPVLQMFYRQGLLLPGHPGNTGVRPLLIGRADLLDGQMQYIYRGNYGLISEEEIIASGIPREQARDMMRLKLKFAFGRIQHPRELLDHLALEDEPVTIRGGVTLRRLANNRFEFALGGETVSVDLNLPPHQVHECPYPLGSYQFPRDYFAVVHSGEGDGWDIRRPSMGSVVVFQGRIYLIDAGPNLAYTLTALGIGINEIEGIFHTHSHDDHFAGLTTLMQADHRIRYFAVPMVRAAVAKKLCALLSIEEEDFNHYFDVHDLQMGAWNDVDGLDVKPVFSPHPVETTVFWIRAMAEEGYRTYAHLADVARLSVLQAMITEDAARPGITQALYDRVAESYREPADIKKVDIGGGMIHGDAGDFAADPSGKIVLAHTAQPLTPAQKRIGSGASFGTVEVLISGQRDFVARTAYRCFKDYFPTIPDSHLGALLNGRMLVFNPETILLKAGQRHDSIYLLLTGQVEVLDDQSEFRSALSAGALLGEATGLHGLPSTETYRAVSFVRVLEIPCPLYILFIERHQLFATVSRLTEDRDFLSRTALLSGVMSTGTLNSLATRMTYRNLPAGTELDRRERTVGLIRAGTIVRRLDGEVLETLGPGCFFGEEAAVFDAPAISSLSVVEDSTVVMIPADLLGAIPNVRWRLFESFEHRTRMEASAPRHTRQMLTWHSEYGVGVQRIDTQHRRLFATANRLLDAIETGRSPEEVNEALDFLLSYTMIHFAEEEELMGSYGYPDAEAHTARHRRLMDQVHEMAGRLSENGVPAKELLDFLRGWIVDHILLDDSRYSGFLNDKGVF